MTLLFGTKTLEIFCEGQKIAEHPKAQTKGARVQNPQHWDGFPLLRSRSAASAAAIRSLPVRRLTAASVQVELRPAAFYEAFIPAEPVEVSS